MSANLRGRLLATAAFLLVPACSGSLEQYDEPSPPRRAMLSLPGDVVGAKARVGRISYDIVDGLPVVGGDIVVPWEMLTPDGVPGQREQALAAVPDGPLLWPNGIVPYEIDPAISDTLRTRINQAIAQYHDKTNIQLVRRDNQEAFVRFVPGDGCRAYIGRIGRPQEVWLAPNCGMSSVVHEIGHALGLWHEQTRQDRDEHVEIRWENIAEEHRGNFDKYSMGRDIRAYDYNSVMHYSSTAFAKEAGKYTIVKLDGSTIPYNRTGLSAGDVRGLAEIYPSTKSTLSEAPQLCGRLNREDGAIGGEVGRVRVQQTSRAQVHHVTFETELPATPIVYAESMTRAGGQPAVVQLVSVRPDGFDFRVAEWAYLDGRHVAEEINYLAVLPSKQKLTLEGSDVGFVTRSAVALVDSTFRRVGAVGGSKRLVFAQPQSDGVVSVARVHGVDSEGFSVRVSGEEAGGELGSTAVGWISVTSPSAALGHRKTARSVTDMWHLVDFSPASWGNEEFVLLVGLQSQYGGDTAHLRYRPLVGPAAEIFVEEEASKDEETKHTSEIVGALGIGGAGLRADAECGTVVVSD